MAKATGWNPSPLLSAPLGIGLLLLYELALCYIAMGWGPLPIGGGRLGGVALWVLAAGPLLGYIAYRHPLIFPYGLFALLIPFDSFLLIGGPTTGTHGVGTATRLLAIVSGLLLAFYVMRRREFVRPPLSLAFFGAYVAFALCSIAWAIQTDPAVSRGFTLLQNLLLFAILCYLPVTRKEFQVLLGAIALGGVASAAYGIDKFYHPNSLAAMELAQRTGRLEVSIGGAEFDVNHWAYALLLPMAIVLIAALRTTSWWKKSLLALGLCILIGGMYVASSRSGFIAFGAILAYLYLKIPRYRPQIAGAAGVLLLLGITVARKVLERFAVAASTGGAGRTGLWHVGVLNLKLHWLFGAGIGNFPIAYNQLALKVFPLNRGWYGGSHNMILGTWVDLGIFGLALLLTAWYFHFTMLDQIKEGDPLYEVRVLLQASLIGIFIAAQFTDIIQFKYYWLVLCLAAIGRSVWLTGRQKPIPVSDA